MEFEFKGKIWYWRGPAPFYFVTMPEGESQEVKSISSLVTYGWGVIPLQAQIGDIEFKTAIIPKDGRYIVPIKASVRKAESLDIDDEVSVKIKISLSLF